MFRKIVAFGDSFAWGDELLDPNAPTVTSSINRPYRESRCYTGLVAKHFGVPFEIHAFPGGSCISTRSIYSWWINQEPNPQHCLVLAQLSGPWRTSQFDQRRQPDENDYPWNRFVHSAWSDYYLENDKLARDYFQLENALNGCDDFYDMIQLETYLFFQAQYHVTAGLLQFNSQHWASIHRIRPHNLLWNGDDINKVVNHQRFYAPQGHLNEQGHERLCALLIDEINRVILAE